MSETPLPLAGIKVVSVASVVCGPLASMLLADYGADVISVEHPDGGDPIRKHGESRDGVPLWWTMLGRNKKCITLYLGHPDGQAIFRKLVCDADVLIENFRPGTLTRWNLSYAQLSKENPGLVLAHITGYGQTGPRASEPGFGTLAEALSGFAHRNGDPDGPPTLPPFGLADCVAGISAAYAIMVALHERWHSGVGQEIDLAISEPLLTVLEPQLTTYDQLSLDMRRTGNRAVTNAPRGIYATRDKRWIAVSASTAATARRLLDLVGRRDLAAADWMESAQGRVAHSDEIDAALEEWFAGKPAAEALAECLDAETPAALVQSPADILVDDQYAAHEAIVQVPHPELGTIRMPNVLFKLSRTRGDIRWPGRELGRDNDEIYAQLSLTPDDLERLQADGVI